MKRKICVLAAAALVLCSAQLVSAHTVKYAFDLTGGAEVPAVVTGGTGTALVTFDLDLVTMQVQADFSGLTGNTTASHIHCCDFLPNTNAGVATTSPSFTGFPLGVKAGTYDHTFDMTLTSSYRAAFLTANGGSVANALQSLLNGLDSGKAYFNIHTSSFGGGEIRGQAVFIPEPTSAVLVLVGLGLPMLLRRSR
ncbi:MAG: CHRD domain-containing protein [Bythopirellula sp.]|nr:CHRD domain-containing protein [Bythopirellula sp.]